MVFIQKNEKCESQLIDMDMQILSLIVSAMHDLMIIADGKLNDIVSRQFK